MFNLIVFKLDDYVYKYFRFAVDNENAKYQRTYISQKMFVYVDINNRTQLIRNFRVRPPHSPLRNVDPVKITHSLCTLGLDNTNKMFYRIEYPSGKCK